MPKKSEVAPCVDCQEEYPRKGLNRMGRCPQCARKAVTENIRQLHGHAGPWYEKWQTACIANAKKYAKGVKRR